MINIILGLITKFKAYGIVALAVVIAGLGLIIFVKNVEIKAAHASLKEANAANSVLRHSIEQAEDANKHLTEAVAKLEEYNKKLDAMRLDASNHILDVGKIVQKKTEAFHAAAKTDNALMSWADTPLPDWVLQSRNPVPDGR